MFPVSSRPEQLRLRVKQRVVVVVSTDDSGLWTEMTDLELQEEDVPRFDLWFKTMSLDAQIRSHRRDEVFRV